MKPYVLLSRMVPPAPRPAIRLEVLTDELLSELEQTIPVGEPIGVDFETFGLQPYHTDFKIRSVAIHTDKVSMAIDFGHKHSTTSQGGPLVRLWRFILDRWVIAHNFWFEGAIIKRFSGELPAQFSCTRLLYKMLASEGWIGQSWSLKDAMVDILGWPKNNDELKAWCKANKLPIGQMSAAPFDILGPYNQLDAAATFELWKYFGGVLKEHEWAPYFVEYIGVAYSEYTQLLESNHVGLAINQTALDELKESTTKKIDSLYQAFLSHKDISGPVAEFNARAVAQYEADPPPEKTKTGATTARWLKWKERLEVAKNTNHFNVDSAAHLIWLFYGQLKLPVTEYTDKGVPKVDKTTLKALAKTCEPIDILLKYRKERDILKFVTSLSANIIDGVYRPSYKIPGPVTSRLACGDV